MGRFTPSRQLLLHALLYHRQPELSLRGTAPPNVGASTSRLPPPKKLRKVMSSGAKLLMQ